MARGGAHFASDELAEVLGHYDIGTIKHAQTLSAGNRRAPKKIIVSEHGKYLLKRRPKGKDDAYHVAFAHAVQLYLEEKGDYIGSHFEATFLYKVYIFRG